MGEAVGPFAQECLDKAFCLAVGLWGVGPGEDVADGKPAQRLGEAAGTVGAAIVGHHPLGLDAPIREPAQRPQKEAGGGGLALVAQHLDIGQARRVIDGDMDEIPARGPVAAPDPWPVTRWPGWSKRPSFLISRWISSPGRSRW